MSLNLLFTGCAQTAPRPAAQTADEQNREMFIAMFDDMLKRDEFYERALGVPRTIPGFQAMKEEMAALYTDDVVVDWMMSETRKGQSRDALIGRLGQLMLGGVSRLNDAEALSMLSAMGDLMGRLSPEQCAVLNAKESGPERGSGFKRLMGQMTPDEVRRFFNGLHQGLRAELTQRPLRATPSRAQLAAMFDALGAKVPGGLYAKSENECVAGAKLMNGVRQLGGEQQSHAITFVLSQFGFYAKAAAARPT